MKKQRVPFAACRGYARMLIIQTVLILAAMLCLRNPMQPWFLMVFWKLLIVFVLTALVFTVVRYLVSRFLKQGEKSEKPVKKRLFLTFVFALLYLGVGAVLPYMRTPEVSEAYSEQFRVQDYYSDTVSCDRAALLEDNEEALAERIRMIANAEERIVLSTFDFRSDISGKQMLAALYDAAERGVEVQVLMDGMYALLHMEGNPWFYALASAENVTIKIYNPINLLTPWTGMSRMHDKYLIADETAYILGGRNTFDYFLGGQDSYKNHDRDMLICNTGGEESSIYQILDYFERIWEQEYCKIWHENAKLSERSRVRNAQKGLRELYGTMRREHSKWFTPTDYLEKTVSTNKVTLLSNPTGLYAKEPWVFYGLSELMKNASSEVIIHTPYVMCDEMMYEAYTGICSKEAEITMMTNSVANNGNPFGAVDYALHKQKILDTGLRVLEYEGGVSYHGKSAAIDDRLAIVGSFNADMKSVYQDTELMLVADSRELCAQLKTNLESYQEEAVPASVKAEETAFLSQKEMPLGRRLLRQLISFVDPWIRFLL